MSRLDMLSIILCTYNRSRCLSWALESLCGQVKGRDGVEVIVVDNNSADDTREVVEDFARRYPFVRYMREEKQGLSHARNRGWQEAYGEYVGYLDDDAKAGPNWIDSAIRIIEELKPDLLGGPYFPFYESEKPDWFLDRFGSRVPYSDDGFIQGRADLSGGNMFIRRDLLEKMGGYNPDYGMTGNTVAYGEETVLQQLIFERCPEATAYYSSDLYILHLVRTDKMALSWRIRQLWSHGNSNIKAFKRGEYPVSGRKILLEGLIGGLKIISRCFFRGLIRNREQYPYYKSYLYDYGLTPLRSVSRAFHLVFS